VGFLGLRKCMISASTLYFVIDGSDKDIPKIWGCEEEKRRRTT